MADQERGGYRRSWVKYLWLYLVVAAVVYVAIYLIFFRDGSGGGGLY